MAKTKVSERTTELTRVWSDGRNEGIREGLLMAIAAITGRGLPWEAGAEQAIIERGDRHFGDSSWQKS